MTDKQLKIYWSIRMLKGCGTENELSYYLQGLLEAGTKQSYIDKIIDKVNDDITK